MEDPRFKKLKKDINNLIEKELNENPAILGINIASLDGTKIATKLKTRLKLTEYEISAANSSLLFLSSRMLQGSLNEQISFNLTSGKDKIIISILTESITMLTYLNRELAELEGLNTYVIRLKKFALHISAIIETSDIIKEEIFVSLKRAIPNAIALAIITKDGLPIKIQSSMPESMISAMIAAIYNIADILLERSSEYSIIAGIKSSIIIHELDESRILCIAVPEAEESKLGSYIAKIKTILK